jgi:thiamine kinase-like enzyme
MSTLSTFPLSQIIQQAKLCPTDTYTIIELTEGLNQQCVELRSTTKKYIIKRFNDSRSFEVERCIYNALKKSDISTQLIKALTFQDINYLLLEKLDGQSLCMTQMSQCEKILLASQILARFHFHVLKASQKQLSTIKTLSLKDILLKLAYSASLTRKQLDLTTDIVSHSINRLENHLGDKVGRTASVCCHGDLNFSNIIANAGNLKVIDFEAASMMPAEYDIAMMLAVNELDESKIDVASQNYLDQYQACQDSATRIERLLDQPLIHAYYLIAILINGLWYLSKSSHSDTSPAHKTKLFEKACSQFRLSPMTAAIPL